MSDTAVATGRETQMLDALQPLQKQEFVFKTLGSQAYDYRMNGKDIQFVRHAKKIGNSLKVLSFIRFQQLDYPIKLPKHQKPCEGAFQALLIVDNDGIYELAHIAFTTEIAKQRFALFLDELQSTAMRSQTSVALIPFTIKLEQKLGKENPFCEVTYEIDSEHNSEEYYKSLYDFIEPIQNRDFFQDFSKFKV